MTANSFGNSYGIELDGEHRDKFKLLERFVFSYEKKRSVCTLIAETASDAVDIISDSQFILAQKDGDTLAVTLPYDQQKFQIASNTNILERKVSEASKLLDKSKRFLPVSWR